MPHSSRCFSIFLLLIAMGANFLLPLLCHHWQTAVPWHDHIIVGPVYPGWESHSHNARSHPEQHAHFGQEPASSTQQDQRPIFAEMDAATHSQVLSLYRPPAWGDSVLSTGDQLLLSVDWLSSLISFPLIRTLDLSHHALKSVALPPPDKPPSISSR